MVHVSLWVAHYNRKVISHSVLSRNWTNSSTKLSQAYEKCTEPGAVMPVGSLWWYLFCINVLFCINSWYTEYNKSSFPFISTCRVHEARITTSHKKVFWMKASTWKNETLKNQPNNMGMTPQHFPTISTSCAILPCVACIYSPCTSTCTVTQHHSPSSLDCCNAIATEHGRYGLSCMQKLWNAQAVVSLYGMLECKLWCEIVLLLNVVDMSCTEEGW